MFDLMCKALFFASNGGVNGLGSVIFSFDILLAYVVAFITSVAIALVLKIPLLPDKPYRYSFKVSAIYPTPILAIGIFSLFVVLNYTFMYNGLVLAIIIGILSALFVKYLFYYVFPIPLNEDDGEDI